MSARAMHLLAVVAVCGGVALAPAASAANYYVDSVGGNDAYAGTSTTAAWKSLAKVNAKSLAAGDSVLLKRGGQWNEKLTLKNSGAAAARITVASYGTGAAPVILQLEIQGTYLVVDGITVDQKKGANDAVLVRNKNNTLRNMTVCNGTKDGVDINDGDGGLIENCTIYNFLAGSYTVQDDAHGIVATDTQGLTIRGCNIYYCSGDCFQTDPDRDADYPDLILIEGCTFWTGPLPASFNAGWLAGQIPGENAVDTKVINTSAYSTATRMRITVRNTVAFGFVKGTYIDNRAAFNMKEKVEAQFYGVTVYNCEIAFRLRGSLGGANTTLSNAVVYGCEKAIRAEDGLANLKIYNGTFGHSIGTMIQFANGSTTLGWSLLNNAWMSAKPAAAGDASNAIVTSAHFVNSAAANYRLLGTSALVNKGLTIAAVTTDRDGVARPQGAAYDIGAYEFVGSTLAAPSAPNALTAAAVSASRIDLAWSDLSSNEDGFKIERKTGSSGSWSQIATVGANVKTYSSTGLAASTAYFFRVRASNAAGNSGYSNEAQATTAAPPNQAPYIESSPWANPNPVTLPQAAAVNVVAGDPDEGPQALKFTWSKVSGPGTVAFSPNGTALSDSSSAAFGAAGSYVLRVTVHDGAASVTADVSVTVHPATNLPPAVNLTAPLHGASFTAPANIAVAANASDADGGVARVEFYANGLLIGSDTTSPYGLGWGNVAAGTYTFTARAVDHAGAATTSAGATVSVALNTSIVLVDFGAQAAANTFGLSGWTTVIMDRYTSHVATGPGGTAIVRGSNAGYNYQGVKGTARTFAAGQRIEATWHNGLATAITFTPMISFNDPDRRVSGTAGTWRNMTSVTIPAGGSAVSVFVLDAASAGLYGLVNINHNFKHTNNKQLVCDKIVLK